MSEQDKDPKVDEEIIENWQKATGTIDPVEDIAEQDKDRAKWVRERLKKGLPLVVTPDEESKKEEPDKKKDSS